MITLSRSKNRPDVFGQINKENKRVSTIKILKKEGSFTISAVVVTGNYPPGANINNLACSLNDVDKWTEFIPLPPEAWPSFAKSSASYRTRK